MAVTNWTFPGTVSSASELNRSNWDNPNNVKANDGSEATNPLDDDDDGDFISERLVCTNYGFSIPSNAAIDGIQMRYERFSDNEVGDGAVQEQEIRLRDENGSVVGNNKADGTDWSSSPEVETKGGSSDLWGHTWNPSDINDSDFGLVLRCERATANSARANIDYVQMRVHYTQPPDDPSGCAIDSITRTQATISWTDNSSNEDGFDIERNVDGGGFSAYDSVSAGVEEYTDTHGLTNGQTVRYRVKATLSGVGDSGYSASGTSTVPLDFAPSVVVM